MVVGWWYVMVVVVVVVVGCWCSSTRDPLVLARFMVSYVMHLCSLRIKLFGSRRVGDVS